MNALAKQGLPQDQEALRRENELMLTQLRHVQDELEHYVLLNQANERKLAELTHRTAPAAGVGPSTRGMFVRLTDFLGITIQNKIDALRASGLFDERWYLERYPDVAQRAVDPVEHYLRYGANEGRDPGPQFNTRWYLGANPDVAASGMNPLLHYVRFGKEEGRQPCEGGVQPPANPFAEEKRRLQNARDEQARLADERLRKIKALEQENVVLTARRQALEGEVARLQGRCEAHARTATGLEAEVAKLKKVGGEQTHLLANRAIELEQLREGCKALERRQAELEQELAAVRQRRDELEGNITTLAKAHESEERSAAQRQAENEARIADLTHRLNLAERAKAEVAQEHSEAIKRADALKQEIGRLKQESAQQRRLHEESVMRETQLSQQNEQLMKKLSELEQAAAEAQRSKVEAARRQAESEARIGELTKHLTLAERDKSELTRQHSEAAKRADTLKQEIERLKQEGAAQHRLHDESVTRERQLRQENQHLMEKLSQLEKRLAEAQGSQEEATRSSEQLRKDLTERDVRQSLLDAELLKAEAQLDLIKDVVLREKNF